MHLQIGRFGSLAMRWSLQGAFTQHPNNVADAFCQCGGECSKIPELCRALFRTALLQHQNHNLETWTTLAEFCPIDGPCHLALS